MTADRCFHGNVNCKQRSVKIQTNFLLSKTMRSLPKWTDKVQDNEKKGQW